VVILCANFVGTQFDYLIDYIPAYLQGDTQRKLRAAITRNFSERDKIPGYIYALNVTGMYRSTSYTICQADSVSKILNKKENFHGRSGIAKMSKDATRAGKGSVLRLLKAFAGGGLGPLTNPRITTNP
jgi:hypothetical protein